MLTQGVGYAATALARISAAAGNPVLIKDVAEACSIPQAYLAKIINTLARKSIVSTQRGIGGGVALAKPATAISLYDLCVALDDPIVQARCMLGISPCSDERACPAHNFWKAHRQREVEFLNRTTLADIAAFEARRRDLAATPPRSADGRRMSSSEGDSIARMRELAEAQQQTPTGGQDGGGPVSPFRVLSARPLPKELRIGDAEPPAGEVDPVNPVV